MQAGCAKRHASWTPVTVSAIETLSQAQFTPGIADCIDLKLIPENLPWGVLSAISGDAAYQFVVRAVELAQKGEIDAICTAPLNKEALHAGGHIFPGHTELLAQLTSTPEVSMMLATPKLRVIHVTAHIGLVDAIERIEPGWSDHRSCATDSEPAGFAHPRIGVCINPTQASTVFSGAEKKTENRASGKPAGRAGCRRDRRRRTPSFPRRPGDFDIVVAMYHDQGHGR